MDEIENLQSRMQSQLLLNLTSLLFKGDKVNAALLGLPVAVGCFKMLTTMAEADGCCSSCSAAEVDDCCAVAVGCLAAPALPK